MCPRIIHNLLNSGFFLISYRQLLFYLSVLLKLNGKSLADNIQKEQRHDKTVTTTNAVFAIEIS